MLFLLATQFSPAFAMRLTHRFKIESKLYIIRRSIAVKMSSNEGDTLAGGKAGRVSAAVAQAKDSSSSKVEITLAPPKGTRDFYPEDHRLKTWMFSIWRDIASLYGFEEYDAPVVEHIELYIRKAGEEVAQQLYDFEDKSGRKLSLRPEMTPSLARMVLARKNALSFPLKWFSLPQCWRYERMTRGRRREHYQWNMDILGVADITAEAELLSAIVKSWERMGLSDKDVGIKVNSRKLLNDLMALVGIGEELWVPVCVLVDKLEKVPLESLKGDVETIGVDYGKMEKLVELLKMKTLEEYTNTLSPESEGIRELSLLFSLLSSYKIDQYVEFDPSVVRGLAYYTGVVFEGFDRSRTLRAICGGGRYDKLMETFGSAPISAVGFGFGDAVIMELLEMKNLLPALKGGAQVLAYAMEGAYRERLVEIVGELREQGIKVDMVLDDRKMKWVMQKGDKAGVTYVLLLGEGEMGEGKVTLKNLQEGKQAKYTVEEAVDLLKSSE